MSKEIGLALVLLATLLGRSPAAADSEPPDLPEPPPAPLVASEEEPAPAALVAPPAAPTPTPVPAPVARAAPPGRASRGAAFGGAALTLALVGVGTAFGVLSQSRSDALSRSTAEASVGLPPIYEGAPRTAYIDLQSQGQLYNSAALACFSAGGATALISAVLFWNAARKPSRDKSLAVLPTIGPGTLTLAGSF